MSMDKNTVLRDLRDKHRKNAERMESMVESAETEDRNLNEKESEEYRGLEKENESYLDRIDRLERQLKVGPHHRDVGKSLDLSDKEKRGYSLLRIIRAKAFPDEPKYRKEAEFEFECSSAIAKQCEREPDGIYIPREVFNRGEKRTMVAASGDVGGYFVEEELRDDMFIGMLRNTSIVARAGATTLPGLRGDISIPKQTGAGQMYWVGTEETDITESNQTIGQVNLKPKHAGAHTRFSRQLLVQSSMAVENFVRTDLERIVGLGIDLAAIYGSGGNQPLGIKNTTGVNKPSAFAATTPTWAECMGIVSLVAADGALPGWGGQEDEEHAMAVAVAWIMNGVMAANLLAQAKATNAAEFVLEREGNSAVIGLWDALASNQVTSGELWFGNWADLIVGSWGDPDLIVNPFTNDQSGVIRLTLHQFADVAARHIESFGYNTN